MRLLIVLLSLTLIGFTGYGVWLAWQNSFGSTADVMIVIAALIFVINLLNLRVKQAEGVALASQMEAFAAGVASNVDQYRAGKDKEDGKIH